MVQCTQHGSSQVPPWSFRPCEAQKAKVLLAMPQKPATAPAAPNGRLGSIRPNLRRNAFKVEQLQEENGFFLVRKYGHGKAAVALIQSGHIT